MRRLVVVVVATLALAACGGSSKQSAAGKSPSGTTAPASNSGGSSNAAACSLVTQADATKLFGHPAQQSQSDNPSSAASSCIWKADTNPDPNAINDIGYLLQVRVYNGEQYYGEKYTTKPTHLNGIGDQAFTNVQGPILQVEFTKHGQTVTMAYSIEAIEANPKPKPEDQQDAVVAMARTAASRF
jgi:hypothetical protein